MLGLNERPIRNFVSCIEYSRGSNAWGPICKNAGLCKNIFTNWRKVKVQYNTNSLLLVLHNILLTKVNSSQPSQLLVIDISYLYIATGIKSMHLGLPWILDKIICVAREMRNPVKVEVESNLHAKKLRKLNGVTDLSLQSKTLRTSSSILLIVMGSNMYLTPSTYIKL